jgi:hypothetical protein
MVALWEILKRPWPLLILAVIALCFATVPRLHVSALIHGWLDGAERAERFVTDKWRERSHRGFRTCWIEINDLQEQSYGRIQMEEDAWDAMSKGDRVEVAYLPGDPRPHHPRGIAFGPLNVAWDLGLLVAEVGAIGYALFRIIRARLPASVPEENAGGWAEGNKSQTAE